MKVKVRTVPMATRGMLEHPVGPYFTMVAMHLVDERVLLDWAGSIIKESEDGAVHKAWAELRNQINHDIYPPLLDDSDTSPEAERAALVRVITGMLVGEDNQTDRLIELGNYLAESLLGDGSEDYADQSAVKCLEHYVTQLEQDTSDHPDLPRLERELYEDIQNMVSIDAATGTKSQLAWLAQPTPVDLASDQPFGAEPMLYMPAT